MKRAKKAGRPKIAPEKRKMRFSVTLRPELVKCIDQKITPDKGRNRIIEETLAEKFLSKTL
jgi:metal-responsive CopG/Arc/MetJ family transcriptional regulator